MGLFVYVDNSNVWIEGQRVSAVAKGMAPDIWTAMNASICDHTWSYDFGRLYDLACPDGPKGRPERPLRLPPTSKRLALRARP